MPITTVVFDVGETLVDESRAWTTLAKAAGVPAFTLMGVLGGLIARDEDHRQLWSVLGVEKPMRTASISEADLYPDALPCLRAAHDRGLVVGIAGNQPEEWWRNFAPWVSHQTSWLRPQRGVLRSPHSSSLAAS